MEDIDKTIEVMKAAMEKENEMKDQTKESMDEPIDEKNQNNPEDKVYNQEVDEALEDEAVDILSEEDEEEDEAAKGADKAAGKLKSGKSLFKSTKSKELEAKDAKIAELTDRVMRTMAEFDNFRKRTEKEKAQMFDFGVKSIIEKLLPIVDNFERGLGTITDSEKEGAFAQGIELIYKQLTTALDEIGVKQIEAVGKEFDPNFHHAVMHGEDESLGENIISDEFQKGYIYHDMVIRHSMVKVVN